MMVQRGTTACNWVKRACRLEISTWTVPSSHSGIPYDVSMSENATNSEISGIESQVIWMVTSHLEDWNGQLAHKLLHHVSNICSSTFKPGTKPIPTHVRLLIGVRIIVTRSGGVHR